jgi:hypothetical protein
MELNDILQILTNKLNTLNERRAVAYHAGDLEQIAWLDNEISKLSETIKKIQSAL